MDFIQIFPRKTVLYKKNSGKKILVNIPYKIMF